MKASYKRYMQDAVEKAERSFLADRARGLYTLKLSEQIPGIIDEIYEELKAELEECDLDSLGGVTRQDVQDAVIPRMASIAADAEIRALGVTR